MLDQLFQALSDRTRRQILQLLRQRDLTAGQIAAEVQVARSTLSGHFNVLKAAGLIVSERQANRQVYSLNLSAFEEALAAVLEFFDVQPLQEAQQRQQTQTSEPQRSPAESPETPLRNSRPPDASAREPTGLPAETGDRSRSS